MIVATAVFVEHDDQQGALPVRSVANRVINRGQQRLSAVKVRWPVELVGIALGVHVIFRSPHYRIKVNRLDERVGWQAVFLAGCGNEVLEVREVFGQRIFPHRFLRQQCKALQQPATAEDVPAFPCAFEQVENGGRVVDKNQAASAVIHVTRRCARMNEGAIAKCLRRN